MRIDEATIDPTLLLPLSAVNQQPFTLLRRFDHLYERIDILFVGNGLHPIVSRPHQLLEWGLIRSS